MVRRINKVTFTLGSLVVALGLLASPILSAGLEVSDVIAREGRGFLEKAGEQLVLHLQGTPYEMGYQHGKLLAPGVKENIKAYLYDLAIGDRGITRERLLATYRNLEPFIPPEFKDEMQGLAEGSGALLEEIQLTNIIPWFVHCTGAAAFGEAAVDGKLYHTRSLDYSLRIGKKKKAQENAILLVSLPDDGIPHAFPTWAGFIGVVSGMNAEGISVGEMGSSSSDETDRGMPMPFLLRKVLLRAKTLQEALEIMERGPRTCGYNFIIADGKILDAVALEVDRTGFEVFRAGDLKENIPPHTPVDFVVRRCNHFVSRELAARQRKEYDPRKSDPGSWLGYALMTNFLRDNYGRLDEPKMITLLRQYPPSHSCLHQALFCPTDLVMWVAQAEDPEKNPFAGAQNQPFYRYDLDVLLKDERFQGNSRDTSPIYFFSRISL